MAWKFSGKMEVYAEIAARYEQYIKLGILQNGEKLPSVRAAAEDCGVNPNTVARAYDILEKKQLVQSIPKKGLYVIFSNGEKHNDDVLNADCIVSINALKDKGATYQQVIDAVFKVYEEGGNKGDKN